MEDNGPSNLNEIVRFMGCGRCLDELPEGESLADYARLSTGFTEAGLQIWCYRHDCNVINLDFEDKGPFPANTTRPKVPTDTTH